MRYFINKENGTHAKVGNDTPSFLHECLTACKVVGKELIDNVEVDKTELIWLEIDQATFEQIDVSIKWSVAEQKFVPYTPPKPIEKTKEEKYDELVNSKIRQKYSLSQELAILRQRAIKVDEFNEYNYYCEQCKREAKVELGII